MPDRTLPAAEGGRRSSDAADGAGLHLRARRLPALAQSPDDQRHGGEPRGAGAAAMRVLRARGAQPDPSTVERVRTGLNPELAHPRHRPDHVRRPQQALRPGGGGRARAYGRQGLPARSFRATCGSRKRRRTASRRCSTTSNAPAARPICGSPARSSSASARSAPPDPGVSTRMATEPRQAPGPRPRCAFCIHSAGERALRGACRRRRSRRNRCTPDGFPRSYPPQSPQSPHASSAADELEDLAASIRAHGIVQPIVVRRRSGSEASGAEATRSSPASGAGAPRRSPGCTTCPITILDVSDKQALELAIVENVQRSRPQPDRGSEGLPGADRGILLYAGGPRRRRSARAASMSRTRCGSCACPTRSSPCWNPASFPPVMDAPF